MVERPYYSRALAALEAAHKACFEHPGRDVLGMSSGPFSGVNEALGIVAELEARAKTAEAELARLRAAGTFNAGLDEAILIARDIANGLSSGLDYPWLTYLEGLRSLRRPDEGGV